MLIIPFSSSYPISGSGIQQKPKLVKSLCENVTSPGGTTESALRVLEEGNFQALIEEAVMSGAEKSKKLGEEFF